MLDNRNALFAVNAPAGSLCDRLAARAIWRSLRWLTGIGPGAGQVQHGSVMVGPPAGEREMPRAFLDYHRATLAMKCDGLSDEELRRQSMPPSARTRARIGKEARSLDVTGYQPRWGEDVSLRLVMLHMSNGRGHRGGAWWDRG